MPQRGWRRRSARRCSRRAAGDNRGRRSPGCGPGRAQSRTELPKKRPLQLCGGQPLCPQREVDEAHPQREAALDILYGAIAVRREEERTVDLVVTKVFGEGTAISSARIADAVAPNHVSGLPKAGPECLEVAVELTVEVAREQEARELEVITLALIGALVDDVIDHDPAGEVGAGHAREGALISALQSVEVLGEPRLVPAHDRGENSQGVSLTGNVVRAAQRSCWIV